MSTMDSKSEDDPVGELRTNYPEHITFTIDRSISPKDYDIIIASYDDQFSGSGELHQYLVSELGLRDHSETTLSEGVNFRILGIDSPNLGRRILLGQVVSIYPDGDTEKLLNKGLSRLLREIHSLREKLKAFLKRDELSIWIPLLATGRAGLTHRRSAKVIADVLTKRGMFPKSKSLASSVMIASPGEVDDREYVDVVRELQELNASLIAWQQDDKWVEDWIAANTPDFLKRDALGGETVSTKPGTEMPDQFHSDHALQNPDEDDLGRDAIAETIATNVTRVWSDQIAARRPFSIHLSGRWGSGKSSILNFLKLKLSEQTKHHAKGWVVVEYNAWRMQDAGPAWWSLLTAVREQGYAALGEKGKTLSRKDWWWRKLVISWPWLLTLSAILMLIVIFLLASTGPPETITETAKQNLTPVPPDAEKVRQTVTHVKKPGGFLGSGNAWTFIVAIITALGSVGALAKIVQGWSRSTTETAEAIRGLQSDPTSILKERFELTIKNIERPVAVFIDDLDRCDGAFVVELLQSLQTAYANVPVLYVVASDRDWIVSAYNQVYKGFKPELSKPGTPLGYLFVKKIFQLSVPVPDLAISDRTRLTQALLRTNQPKVDAITPREDRVEQVNRAAAAGDLPRVAQIQKAALSEGQNLTYEIMQAVSDPDNQSRIQHKLLEYTEHFDGNPRSIKRLVNALTFTQGYIISAAEDIPFEKIVRWTILSLRFPYTADVLAERPMTEIPSAPTEDFPAPAAIRGILKDMSVEDIRKVASFG